VAKPRKSGFRDEKTGITDQAGEQPEKRVGKMPSLEPITVSKKGEPCRAVQEG